MDTVDDRSRMAASPAAPGTVRFLVALVLLLVLWSGTRLGAALFYWKVLREYAGRGGPLYPALSAAVWLIGALAALRGIGRRGRRAWTGLVGLFGAYFVWCWLDRLFVQWPRPSWPFALVCSLLLLWLALGAAFHPATRRFFREGES